MSVNIEYVLAAFIAGTKAFLTVQRDFQLAGRWAGLYTYPDNHPQGWKTDGESDFTVYTETEDDKVKIHGEGHDKVGPFEFDGHVSSDDVKVYIKFLKHYHTHSWHYSGTIDQDTNVMHGMWGVRQEGGGGYFAFHLANKDDADVSAERNIAGNWSGSFHTTASSTTRGCHFELTSRTGKMDDQLTIVGTGKSEGDYKIKGVVSPSGQIIFAKIYNSSPHLYLYRGALSEGSDAMEGHWAGKGAFGTFDFKKD
ncbi:hypothetical protein Hte_007218 [Hypoxylon texense]